jgi:type I restriction enzyme, S subunit
MRTVALGDIAEFINGAAFKPEDWGEGGARIIRIQNLNDPAKPYNRTRREVAEKYLVPPGTLLVSWSASLGVFEWNEPDTALLNQHIFKVIPNRVLVRQDYLRNMLARALVDMAKFAHGSTMQHVNRGEFLATRIPLPPLKEQKQIAAILDQADELRRKRQRALDRLNQLGQAIFVEMFGDPTTNPRAWPTAKASELADRITVGLVVRPASYYCESGVPAIRGTNIKESGIELSDVVYFSEQDNETALAKSRIWSNDIVIVRSGRPGLAAIVPPELHGANAIDVLIFSPNREKVVPQFIRDLINSEGGKRLVLSESRGQVQQHFNVGSLSTADFFVPPFNLQLEYQCRIQELHDQAIRLKSAALASDSLFTSLQHRAFRGELTGNSLKDAVA